MFYPLGKNSEKPYGGRGVASNLPPPERPRAKYSQNQEVSKSDPSKIGFPIT